MIYGKYCSQNPVSVRGRCYVRISMVSHYLDIFERTYVCQFPVPTFERSKTQWRDLQAFTHLCNLGTLRTRIVCPKQPTVFCCKQCHSASWPFVPDLPNKPKMTPPANHYFKLANESVLHIPLVQSSHWE